MWLLRSKVIIIDNSQSWKHEYWEQNTSTKLTTQIEGPPKWTNRIREPLKSTNQIRGPLKLTNQMKDP
jgi:hypothetical protein